MCSISYETHGKRIGKHFEKTQEEPVVLFIEDRGKIC